MKICTIAILYYTFAQKTAIIGNVIITSMHRPCLVVAVVDVIVMVQLINRIQRGVLDDCLTMEDGDDGNTSYEMIGDSG